MLRIFFVLTWSIHCHRKHPEYLVAGHLNKDNHEMWAIVNHPPGVLAVKDFKDVLHHTIGIKSGKKWMRTKKFWKAIQNLGKIRLISSTVAFLLMLPLENISIFLVFLVGIIDNGNASQGFCKLLYFLKISQFHLLPWGKFILKLFTTPRMSSSVNLFVCKKNCKIF